MRINRVTRILHFGMVLTVLFQLTTSQFMQVPEPGEIATANGLLFFSLHKLSGIMALLVCAIYATLMIDERDHWGRLYPWFSSARRATLLAAAKSELPGLLQGRLVPPAEQSPLAGAVHGLGFLLLCGMGLTGVFVLVNTRSDGLMGADVQLMREIHELLSLLLWPYLTGHALMAFYHQWAGHRLMSEMFDLRDR